MSDLINDEVSKLAAILGIQATEIAVPSLLQHQPESVTDANCTLFIDDNLTTLRYLVETARGNVDFCYIDPPYNTGQSFAYNDSRLAGRSSLWGGHADWMAFMLPRLVLLRLLLKEDGIVAISIDDYEYHRLKVIMDALFGEDNHIATIIVTRSVNGKGSKSNVSVNHDYVLLYGKSNSALLIGLPESRLESYDKRDEHGWYKVDGLFRKKGDASLRTDRPNMFYPLFYDASGNVFTENVSGTLRTSLPLDSSGVERRWLWGPEKAKLDSWRLYASKNGVIYVKNYLTDEKRIKIKSTWNDFRYLTERATNEIKDIFGQKIFETPKPIALLEDLIECCAQKSALILDFFAGTGTTAHAAHLVNMKDGGDRKVILAETDCPTPSSHISKKHGYLSVADIAEARLSHIKKIYPTYNYTVRRSSTIGWNS